MAAPKPLIDQLIFIDPTDPNFSPEAFDSRIINNGILFVHYKAIICPGSDSESGSIRSTHHDGHGCENGFFYIPGGTFYGVIQNLNVNKVISAPGNIDNSVCYVLLPRFYADKPTEPMYFSVWDKLAIKNCHETATFVPYWETLIASQTGIDRARFPIKKVEYVIDAFGNQYKENIDFKIYNGSIQWISPTNRPGFNLMTNLGTPFSLRYLYEPILYVNKVLHEIRLLNTINPETGEKKETRYPALLECLREINFLDTSRNGNNGGNDNSPTANRVPGDGSNFTTPK